jgi:signal transduction histidine kinase
MATELRPLMLDDLGLVSTIEWVVNDFSKRTGVQVELHLPQSDFDAEPGLSTALFRVLQESLTNVTRHAQASRVRIALSVSDGEVRLRIEDNGCGIAARATDKPKTFGLLGMRERAALLGGDLLIDSRIDAGTSIEMIVPRAAGLKEVRA